MNQDSYFFIGKTHNVCQDYALHGLYDDNKLNKNGFVIVSDGCSGSPDTDFGSRFLAMGAKNTLKNFVGNPSEFVVEGALINATQYGHALQLHPQHLDATLLVALVYNKVVTCVATGDGVIVAKDKDGVITIIDISFAGGAPVYLNYRNNLSRFNALLDTYDCTKTIKTTIVYKDGEEENSVTTNSLISSFDFEIEKFDFVAVMTDGVSSFQRPVITGTSKTYESMKTIEVVRELMNIKGVVGQFVERRCKAFLRNCAKDGIIHADDFSVGMLYLGDK